MILTPDQIEKIAQILNNRISIFVGKSLGPDYLSTEQKAQLDRLGINLDQLYQLHKDPLFLQYQLGAMSQVFSKLEVGRYKFPEFVDAIRRGEYIKMSEREKASLHSVKMQSLGDIRSFQGRIFTDVHNIISSADKNNRNAQERVIRREIRAGLAKRQSYKAIAQELGNKTGDWARNWNRIVQYVGHAAFEEGKSAVIEKKSGNEAWVYKTVYEGACKHCIRLYLENGIGSKPKLFKLSELKANGNNIGRKVAEWLPVVGPVHPYCRCHLNYIEQDEVWDKETKEFAVPKDTPIVPKVKRSRVKMIIGDKEYMV